MKTVSEVAADAAIRAGEVYPLPECRPPLVISQANDDAALYADVYRHPVDVQPTATTGPLAYRPRVNDRQP